ncbi:cytochrome P450 [Earliella scabrosa]|nr:cytochrome P450 [Earliella scabrosa]
MDDPAVLYALLVIAIAVYVVKWRTHPLNAIPTVGGPSAPLLSFIGAINFLRNGKQLLIDGYQRYRGSAYKVALFDQWVVIVNGSKMVDELRKRPDEELSFIEGVEEFMQSRFTLGRDPLDDPYHVDIVKEKLMRTLVAVLPDVIDELSSAVPDYIPTQGQEWTTVNVMTTTQKIVARASNRVFVGLPVCRDKEYLDIAIKFTIDMIKDRTIITKLPLSMKILLGKFLSSTGRSVMEAVPHLKPLLDERREKMAEYGDDWLGKPNDMLQWVLEQAIPRNATDRSMVERILLVNFAAIHTSSNILTFSTEYNTCPVRSGITSRVPLRDEIEPIVAAEGWTKAAMGKMWKVDSLLRESSRINGISLTSVTRKAMKDVTLNDGTFLPKGTVVLAATYPIHLDEDNYASAAEFDPFRFSRMREASEGESTKHQFVNTSIEYVLFGHGKHAWFFAANELKAMLAYIVVNYDLKIPNDGPRPENIYFGPSVIPDPSGEIMFRKRKVSV